MKNTSLQHPFPTAVDRFFDKNKDGKLGLLETVFRDAHINEMNKKKVSEKTVKGPFLH